MPIKMHPWQNAPMTLWNQCVNSLPEKLYEEALHTFFAKLVIDLTPGDAKLA